MDMHIRHVSPTSQIRIEVQMKSGHSLWAKHREASEVIDIHGLFGDYWSSNNHEFTVLSQSFITDQLVHTELIGKDRTCCDWKA